jgi:hypothetical protein
MSVLIHVSSLGPNIGKILKNLNPWFVGELSNTGGSRTHLLVLTFAR